ALLIMPLALVGVRGVPALYEAILGSSIALQFAYLALAATLRCPACRRRFLIESRGPKHPAPRRAPFGYWGTTVWDMLTRRRWTCMYCGTTCSVRRMGAAPRVPSQPVANGGGEAITGRERRRDPSTIP